MFSLLHPLSDFIDARLIDAMNKMPPAYWYEGRCSQSGNELRLPRTQLAEAIARGLMQQLAVEAGDAREGKMYGVLLVQLSTGEHQVLKAFSGLVNHLNPSDWVPPLPGRNQVALQEALTLTMLEEIKQQLIALQHLPERRQHEAIAQEFAERLLQMAVCHQQQRQQRQQQRQQFQATLSGQALTDALAQIDNQSRKAGGDRQRLKQARDAALQPLKLKIDRAEAEIRLLKQQRQALSQRLQAQLHAAYRLTNFAGRSQSLQQLAGSLPTGTGDCCAPKLLHYAASHQLKPLAMAEFWWGASSSGKVQGNFYTACVDRCQPLMGFLLSGLSGQEAIAFSTEAEESFELPILYQDSWIIAVNKPTGLLSVPGRYSDRQDSVFSRLRCQLSDVFAVHRLDQETSGILLLARDPETDRHLQRQFQQRSICKLYEALLAGAVSVTAGEIDLPLWGNPADRPYQTVDWQRGKPSLTRFQVIEAAETTRIEFLPLTGRTHQLRVHAADEQGLGASICGDRLYGSCPTAGKSDRLYLHAKEISFQHPHLGKELTLKAETPF